MISYEPSQPPTRGFAEEPIVMHPCAGGLAAVNARCVREISSIPMP